MPQRLSSLAAILLLLTAGPLAAQPRAGDCLIGPGLGSTLLVPYFEVDLDDPFALTTLFSIANGLSDEVLARVVFWTDWGVPTLAFDVYLEGFDLQTVNLRDVFAGVIPSTGDGADLSGFSFCSSPTFTPVHTNPVLTVDEISQLEADHTGVQGPLATMCAGENHGDSVARGYITVDVVDECSGVQAHDPSFTPENTTYPYFSDGGGSDGIGIIDNQLWGDVIYVDVSGAAAQANEVISLWADSTLFSGTDRFTFYGGRSGWDGRDDRVPLPNLWNQRFLNGGLFGGGASVVVWQDIGEPSSLAVCGQRPAWYPLGADGVALDEDAGNLVSIEDVASLATQRVDVSDLGIPYPFGWVQVGASSRQLWTQPTLTAGGLFSASLQGTPVEFLCTATPPSP